MYMLLYGKFEWEFLPFLGKKKTSDLGRMTVMMRNRNDVWDSKDS